jgi:type IV pilus assembly protein PilY1
VGVSYQQPSGDWAGKLYRFEMNGSANPGSWSFEPAADLAGPPTAAPGVAMDEARNIWVYLGPGRYFSEADKLDTSTQYFYGIRADSMDSGNIVNNTSGSVNLLDTTGVDVYTDGTVTGVSGIGTWDELVAEIYNHDGWRYTLGTGADEAGERVLNKPIVIGGLVLDTTFTPNQDPCGFSGNSAIYGFYYKTGTAYYEEVFVGGSEEVDVGGETKTKVGEKVDVGVGKASGVSVHVGSQSGATGFVQQSTGIVESMDLQTAGGLKSGFIYWRER